MFKKVKPYMGEYMRYTKKAVVCITLALVLSVSQYFLLYQIIEPLIMGENLLSGTVFIYIALIAVCMVGYALLYVQGLSYSHMLEGYRCKL